MLCPLERWRAEDSQSQTLLSHFSSLRSLRGVPRSRPSCSLFSCRSPCAVEPSRRTLLQYLFACSDLLLCSEHPALLAAVMSRLTSLLLLGAASLQFLAVSHPKLATESERCPLRSGPRFGRGRTRARTGRAPSRSRAAGPSPPKIFALSYAYGGGRRGLFFGPYALRASSRHAPCIRICAKTRLSVLSRPDRLKVCSFSFASRHIQIAPPREACGPVRTACRAHPRPYTSRLKSRREGTRPRAA